MPNMRRSVSAGLAAVANIVEIVVPDPNSAYRKTTEKLALGDHGYGIAGEVGDMAAVLDNILRDAQSGPVSSVADHARAEVFDDFLDHAKSYRRAKRKNEGAVIAGVVFEDSIRRCCRKYEIEERGVKLDSLITALNKSGTISDTKAKRARVAADLRTKATHAQWDEFDDDDLRTTIEFTESFIGKHFGE
ncbi:MAG: hypothetical protein U5K38_14490 [Woeseiaceae bacterium]|nr:hypothetical protein [Woeseiaceae bacterium]